MEITVRPVKISDVKGIVDLNCSEVKEWYRNPIRKRGQTDYAKLTPVQRFLHGGYWMDEGFCRRHLSRYFELGNKVYVAEAKRDTARGSIVGEIEVWFDHEPSPFGRYAEIEMIIADQSTAPRQIEGELLRHVSREMRSLGHVNLDISPEHSGGSKDLLKESAFRPIWDTRCFSGVPSQIDECDEVIRLDKLPGDNRNLGPRTIQFCHYEPFRFAWDNRFEDWYLSKEAHHRLFEPLFKKKVRLMNMRREFILLVERLSFFGNEVRAILWAPTNGDRLKKDKEYVRKTAMATAQIVGGFGIRKFLFYAPWFCENELKRLGYRGGTEKDLWLRKSLV